MSTVANFQNSFKGSSLQHASPAPAVSRSFTLDKSTVGKFAAKTSAAIATGILISTVASSRAFAAVEPLQDRCAGMDGTGNAGTATSLCTKNIDYLSGGLMAWALILCILGIMISAVLWALGSKGQNPGQELTGKKGFIVCLAGAFALGAAVPIINFMQRQTAGLAETPPGVQAGTAGAFDPNFGKPAANTYGSSNGASNPAKNTVNNSDVGGGSSW